MSPNSKYSTAIFLQDVETRLKEHFPETKVVIAIRETMFGGVDVCAVVYDISAHVYFDVLECITNECYPDIVADKLIENIEKVLARRKDGDRDEG